MCEDGRVVACHVTRCGIIGVSFSSERKKFMLIVITIFMLLL